MKTEDLNYTLPPELIAQHPSQKRQQSRLLVLDRTAKTPADRQFSDLAGYLDSGDSLVLNNTKVLPARFYARKLTGAQLEGLFIHEEPDGQWQVLLKNARTPARSSPARQSNCWTAPAILGGRLPPRIAR
ncbi:MAG: S-adenosylmethionine:tRNA ribosyltransferase-isomerase [Planctomycetota bacterium]|jgi:S-adenosylmethionine:tRNA ribosyltransferase-isomerase